ncbi:MAG: DMT family transporter [Desulfurispora sp.]|uniref:DMT family transporter n=1 Tax=Desulfurispora sp. TaxID=3014275 RepID=UPI00404B4500
MEKKGLALIILAATMWGIAGTVAKFMFNNNASPFDLVQMRLLISFFILLTLLSLTNRSLLKISRSDLLYFLIFGTLGVAMVQFTYMYTISLNNVATAIFLQYLAPALVLVYGLLTRSENLTPAKCAALACAIAGGLGIVRGNLQGGLAVNTTGLISGLASALAFAFYTIYGKRGLSKYNPWTMLTWGFGIAALVWSFYAPPWQTWLAATWTTRLFFLYIAIFATTLPFGLFFLGLKYINPVKAGITSTLEPVIGTLASFFFLGEVLAPVQIAGCLLILVAIVLINLQQNKPAAASTNLGSPDNP